MRLIRTITTVAAGALAVGLSASTVQAAPAPSPAAVSPAAVSPAVTLAAPTGPYRTGTALLHLRDDARVDPLDPAGRKRELMVQLWYPAIPLGARAPYAQPAEAASLQANYPVPAGAFGGTTVSRLRAPVLPGRHKVVFFSHGLCAARTDTTAVNQQLASLGYVVVALGHTHESPAVQFPGGRVETTTDPEFCLAGGDPFSARYQAVLKRLLAVRVADTRFALDQLTRINRGHNPDASGIPLPRGLVGTMDTRQVGMFGHSFGGGTAAAVLAADRRFVAGVDLDGFIIGSVKDTGLRKPFLVMGSDYHDPTFDPSWATFLPALTGWHRWFMLDGAGHYRFIDLGGSTHKWGLDATLRVQDPATWASVFGDIDDRTSQEIVVRVTTAFFEKWLRGRPQPILDHPSDSYPQLVDRTATI